eukprot:gene18822-biopygen5668
MTRGFQHESIIAPIFFDTMVILNGEEGCVDTDTYKHACRRWRHVYTPCSLGLAGIGQPVERWLLGGIGAVSAGDGQQGHIHTLAPEWSCLTESEPVDFLQAQKERSILLVHTS